MEGSVGKSRSDVRHKPRRMIHHPYPHHMELKTLSSGRLSSAVFPRDGDDEDEEQTYQSHYGRGRTASIPFSWESRPGTPKVRSSFRPCDGEYDDGQCRLPPLTPPPRYSYSSAPAAPSSHRRTPHKQCELLRAHLFPRTPPRKSSSPPSPTYSSYSFSSDGSWWPSSCPAIHGHVATSLRRMEEREQHDEYHHHVPTLPCFGFARGGGSACSGTRRRYLAAFKVLRGNIS